MCGSSALCATVKAVPKSEPHVYSCGRRESYTLGNPDRHLYLTHMPRKDGKSRVGYPTRVLRFIYRIGIAHGWDTGTHVSCARGYPTGVPEMNSPVHPWCDSISPIDIPEQMIPPSSVNIFIPDGYHDEYHRWISQMDITALV